MMETHKSIFVELLGYFYLKSANKIADVGSEKIYINFSASQPVYTI